ncbi:MAG: hypothetical protein GXY98_00810 [Erysipelothrix sp.]|nr:hypothetical protein [Erysipelothrix sp.]
MNNYFSKTSIEFIEEEIRINKKQYALYQSYLTLLLVIPWLLIIAFMKRDQPWMLPLNVGVFVVCFALYVWLQYVFTSKLKAMDGELIPKEKLIVFRRRFYITVIEFVLPVLLMNFISTYSAAFITLIFTISRLVYMLYKL